MGTDNFVVGLFIFCYCLAILLRYNLHTIKFTYLKCTVQWFFSIFMELGSHYHNLILEHIHYSKMRPVSLSSHSSPFFLLGIH